MLTHTLMAVLPMILLKKRGTGDVRSPLNLGGRSNTYARKEYKAGSYVQESLLESLGLLIAP